MDLALLRRVSDYCAMAEHVRDMGKLELAKLLREGAKDVIVVDVRDLDRAGGHVKGSVNIRAAEFQANAKKYAAEWTGRKVVFYCMYSQIRGPTSAAALAQACIDLKLENPPVAYVLRGGFRSMAAQGQYKDIMEGFEEMK